MTHYHQHAAVACPECGGTLNCAVAAVGNDERGPIAGDLTVCMHCNAMLVFDEPPALHGLTTAEFDELDLLEQMELLRAQGTVISMPRPPSRN